MFNGDMPRSRLNGLGLLMINPITQEITEVPDEQAQAYATAEAARAEANITAARAAANPADAAAKAAAEAGGRCAGRVQAQGKAEVVHCGDCSCPQRAEQLL